MQTSEDLNPIPGPGGGRGGVVPHFIHAGITLFSSLSLLILLTNYAVPHRPRDVSEF